MSNYIYITRHGQSQWNVEKKVQGVTDTPLTQQGIEQAHALALKLKEEKIHVDEILYSPLSRAADTARIIAEENKLPLTLEPRLIEQNFGEYEGHEWTKHPGVFHEVKKQFKTFLLVSHGGVVRMFHSYFFSESNEDFVSTSIENCEIRKYVFK